LDDAQTELRGKQFDKVLLQDVLEHLRFPERLLNDCHSVLKPKGLLLVSVPNVANITVRLSLLFGNWNYTERGILDKTHYRFYTHRTARQLLENCEYHVIKQMTTVMPVELALGLSPKNPFMRCLNSILALLTSVMPGLMGYQCIFIARSKRSGSPDEPKNWTEN
jgi:SAM-dependent methyltransferase